MGGIYIYVREDITSKIRTKNDLPTDIEALFYRIEF